MSTSISATEIGLPDDAKLKLGTGEDLEIYHDGSNSYLTNGTGVFNLQGSGSNIQLQAVNGESGLIVKPDNAVELYFNGSKKLETTSNGIEITSGTPFLTITASDNDGDATLNLVAKSQDGSITGGISRIVSESSSNSNGASAMSLQTRNNSNTIVTAIRIDKDQDVTLPVDNQKLRFGASQDLQIYHDSTHSYLSNGTGNLFVEIPDGQKFQVQHGSEAIINGYADGRVEIYHDNSKKLETISTGLNVTGGVRLGGNNSANELDDYEEGTFTPLLSDNLSSGSASSYQNQSGHYTKVGNIVHIIGALRADNISNLSSSANLKIRGLPFVASDVTTGSGEPDMLLITFINNLSSDSNRGHVYGRIENGVAAAQLGYAFSTGQSAGNLLFSQINNGGNNTYFTFSGTYRTG